MTGMDLWLLLVVMSLAIYRLTRLVVEDVFPPVLWLRDRVAGGWRPLTQQEWNDHPPTPEKRFPWPTQTIDDEVNRYVTRWRWVPQWIADLVSCPWCASGWIAGGVTAATWATVGLPVPLLVWPAVWAAGALLAGQDWA